MTPTNLTARIEAMINESTDAHENGDNTVSALSVALLLLDVQAHLAQSPLREAPAPLTVPGPDIVHIPSGYMEEKDCRKCGRPMQDPVHIWSHHPEAPQEPLTPAPQASRFLSGDSHGRVLSHDEGGYTYTRGGKLLFQASHGSRAIDLWPDATPDDVHALVFALGGALLALAAVPAPVPLSGDVNHG